MLDQAQGNSPDIVIMDGSQASSFLRDTLTIGGTAILRGETADDPGYGFADSVASGLSMCPRRLESRYLYDRQGSAIFDRITEQPEYTCGTRFGLFAENRSLAAGMARVCAVSQVHSGGCQRSRFMRGLPDHLQPSP